STMSFGAGVSVGAGVGDGALVGVGVAGVGTAQAARLTFKIAPIAIAFQNFIVLPPSRLKLHMGTDDEGSA
ncbi:MAG: hypothetical protein N2545_11805, partial [Thermoflexales bacterium]|nr:hypothetical protein [Thermoflexales bacterium]